MQQATQTGYSFQTSYQPYLENKAQNKPRQCEKVLLVIRGGADNLLQISGLTGIPQAIISARVGDLITDGKVKYDGTVVYNGRLRKKIVLIHEFIKGTQIDLF